MNPIVLGIFLIVVGLALPIPIVLLLINPLLLKPGEGEGTPNLGLRETLDNPFKGVSRMALVPLMGLDGEISDAKSRKQFQFTVEKGHHSIQFKIVLFRLNKAGEEVAFDSIAYTNSSPYEIGDNYVVNMPVKTVSLQVVITELDGETFDDGGVEIKHAPTWKLILASVFAGLLLGLTVAFVHMGMQCIWNPNAYNINPVFFILPFIFLGGYGVNLQTGLFYAAFAVALIGGSVLCFFLLKNKKGVKKGKNHG